MSHQHGAVSVGGRSSPTLRSPEGSCQNGDASRRPRILVLADRRNWAYDHSAQHIKNILSERYEFSIQYVEENPASSVKSFDPDLVHVCWWGENWHHKLNLPKSQIMKEISSFRWREEAKFGYLDPKRFAEIYLNDAGTLISTSRKMQTTLNDVKKILYTPNGIDPRTFFVESERTGPMVIGWAGNINDPCKGIHDIIVPACEGNFRLLVASGNIKSRDDMRRFYNKIDVLCVASTAEGEPLPLIESLACGCFIVSVDVGIVPEIIKHGDNGLIVDRSIPAFQAALTWCNSNIEFLRNQSTRRAADLVARRAWAEVLPYWQNAYDSALAAVEEGVGT